jgi:hypothetical protein
MQPDGSYVQRAPSGAEDPESPATNGSFAFLMQKTLHDSAKA